jgi:hypothetical protein
MTQITKGYEKPNRLRHIRGRRPTETACAKRRLRVANGSDSRRCRVDAEEMKGPLTLRGKPERKIFPQLRGPSNKLEIVLVDVLDHGFIVFRVVKRNSEPLILQTKKLSEMIKKCRK